jgi:hypothetical protein
MKDVLLVSGGDPANIFHEIHHGLESFTNLTFDTIDHYYIRTSFQYKSFRQRTYNFFRKNISGRNIKHDFYNASVREVMDGLQKHYKRILIIRPDLLSDYHLQQLRERTGCFIAYYWDTVGYAPRKKNIVHFFDRILSFDPGDCEKYGFDFQCNFYYYENQASETRYQVYNLSSLDERKEIMEEIAMALEGLGLSYLFKGFNKKPFKNPYIQYTERISYQNMLNEASHCNVVLDVTKPGQKGLTFRPFEALGLNKKLITTNSAIKDYEFYDPENVVIVQPGRVRLEKEFFETPFKEVPSSVKKKYHLKQWLNDVLGE